MSYVSDVVGSVGGFGITTFSLNLHGMCNEGLYGYSYTTGSITKECGIGETVDVGDFVTFYRIFTQGIYVEANGKTVDISELGLNQSNINMSPDAITNLDAWILRTLPSSANWRSVTYGNGRFVAVTYGTTNAASAFYNKSIITLPKEISTYIKLKEE